MNSTGDGDGDTQPGDGDGDSPGIDEPGDGDAEDPGPMVIHEPADTFPQCPEPSTASDSTGLSSVTLTAPFPTMQHVSLLAMIEGDSNHDSSSLVRFRALGSEEWLQGSPLRHAPADTREGFSWEDRFAGSLFGLSPDTEYEVQIRVEDPDGGCFTESVNVATRSVPESSGAGSVLSVTPDSIAAELPNMLPGEVLQLQAGEYSELVVPVDGSADAPLVIRGGEGVEIHGDVRLDGRAHVIVEELLIHGQVKFNGGDHIAVRRCEIHTDGDGIVAFTRAENSYIADNTITGPSVWDEPSLGASGDNLGEGIAVTGPGHVIEHNRVSGFRDAISLLEDDGAVDQFSIDILRNEISEALDDGIEADFCAHNCRVIENRITNSFIAMSSQPGLGGPTYFIRNSSYNVILSAFKLQRGSVGDVVVHNTTVKNGDALGIYTDDVFSGQLFRNNLFLGGDGTELNGWSTGQGDVVSLRSAESDVDLSHGAYGSESGAFAGRFAETDFQTLDELNAVTNGSCLEIDRSVFESEVAYPSAPLTLYEAQDFRLAAGTSVVDSGAQLAGINSGYLGEAPDRGAIEQGRGAPNYGPRPAP